MKKVSLKGQIRSKQLFKSDQVKIDAQLSPKAILQFIEDFQTLMNGPDGKRKAISLRVPEKLLELFKKKARAQNQSYQRIIVELMRDWLRK